MDRAVPDSRLDVPALDIPRRAAVAGLITLTGGALAACQTYGGPGQPLITGNPPPASSGAATAPGAAAPIAKASDIPVGGGKVFPDQAVVITQPRAGTFKGFSATCTHQNCLVSDVSGGTINCPCHGSRYAVEDAAVVAGPAPRPLPEKPIRVEGQNISLG